MSNRYLVVAPQGLGDSLEATPFLAALRSAKPGATIDVVVLRSPAKVLFEGLPDLVSRVHYLPFWEAGSRKFLAALAVQRWQKRYDALFMMYPAARREYHLLARAFPARKRFTHRYTVPSAGSLLWLYDELIPVRPHHNVLRNLDLLDAAGIPYRAPDRYSVPEHWIALEEARRRDIVVHVGTIAHDGLEARRWPLEKFRAAIKELLRRGHEVTALAGPAERTETLQLRSAVPQLKIYEGSLQQVARFLSRAGVVLSNDSGIGHLAAGVRTPNVALFGPTPLEHAPYGPQSRPLRPSNCPPCFDPRLLNTGCALNIDYRCLKDDLGVDLVVNAVEEALEGSLTG